MERIKQVAAQLAPSIVHPDVKRVLITGAAGNIAYSLISLVASGQTLGPHQKLILHLLEIPQMEGRLKGVVMEIEDCAYPLVVEVVATTLEEVAFKDVDVAMLVGAMPRAKGMERKDLLLKNKEIFESQGKALDKYASKNVKVVVVGNPANTNCLIAQKYAPSIPRENFSALTRLDENRARAMIAAHLKVPVDKVHGVSIWGNHSATQYPCYLHGHVEGPLPLEKTPLPKLVTDMQWIEKVFIPGVQQRGAAVIQARQSSSASSAAKAVSDHVHDWLLGTHGRTVSMAVASNGEYGIPKGLVFSFPVTCSAGGSYQIVQGLPLDEFSKRYLQATTQELLEEKATAGM